MAIGVRILSDNLSGLTTNVTYLPESGGTIDLGVQTFPFNYISEYYFGTYNCYVPTYGFTYSLIVEENISVIETPTPTVTPSPTPWNYCYSINGGFNNQPERAVEDPDEKIIFVGNFTTYNGLPFNRIIRVNSDASIDDTFNIGTGFNNVVYDVKLQSDGKILVGGSFSGYNETNLGRIVRLNSDGSIDNTFETGTGFNSSVFAIEIQIDGKILVGGAFTQYNGDYHPELIRLNSDGSVDNTFNVGSGTNNRIFNILTQNDEKIILLGGFTMYNDETHNRIVRLNYDGTLDNTFSAGTGFNGITFDGVIEDDGKLVVVGAFFEYDNQINRQIVRLNTDGSIDNTFNSNEGFNRLSGLSYSTTVIKYSDKYFVIGDFDTYNLISAEGLIQLNSDGSIDESFNYGTGLVYSGNVFNTGIILRNGVHLVFGEFSEYNGNQVGDIAFLNPFGTLLNCPTPTETIEITTTPTQTGTPTQTPTRTSAPYSPPSGGGY